MRHPTYKVLCVRYKVASQTHSVWGEFAQWQAAYSTVKLISIPFRAGDFLQLLALGEPVPSVTLSFYNGLINDVFYKLCISKGWEQFSSLLIRLHSLFFSFSPTIGWSSGPCAPWASAVALRYSPCFSHWMNVPSSACNLAGQSNDCSHFLASKFYHRRKSLGEWYLSYFVYLYVHFHLLYVYLFTYL